MKRKTRNRLNGIAFVVWLVSASAVDCASWIPFVACAAATIWLGLFLDDGKKSRGGECHALD